MCIYALCLKVEYIQVLLLWNISSDFFFFPPSVWLIFQLEEVRGVPASSEKAISDATARKEEMEKQKVKEEEKLKEVMKSLKEETSGLQQDKEVCVFKHIFLLTLCDLNCKHLKLFL